MPKKPRKQTRRPRTLLEEILDAIRAPTPGRADRAIRDRNRGAEDRDVSREAFRRNFTFLDRLAGETRPPRRAKNAR
jgi:hypothetical protein